MAKGIKNVWVATAVYDYYDGAFGGWSSFHLFGVYDSLEAAQENLQGLTQVYDQYGGPIEIKQIDMRQEDNYHWVVTYDMTEHKGGKIVISITNKSVVKKGA